MGLPSVYFVLVLLPLFTVFSFWVSPLGGPLRLFFLCLSVINGVYLLAFSLALFSFLDMASFSFPSLVSAGGMLLWSHGCHLIIWHLTMENALYEE